MKQFIVAMCFLGSIASLVGAFGSSMMAYGGDPDYAPLLLILSPILFLTGLILLLSGRKKAKHNE
jgi:O-antigen/teichoic acid export membrane protein